MLSREALERRLRVERDRRSDLEDKAALYREALGKIVAAENDVVNNDGDLTLVLNAEEKMRAIAARALIGEPALSPEEPSA